MITQNTIYDADTVSATLTRNMSLLNAIEHSRVVGVYEIIVTSSQNRLKPFVVLGLRV